MYTSLDRWFLYTLECLKNDVVCNAYKIVRYDYNTNSLL
jgi:hypothetical protein